MKHLGIDNWLRIAAMLSPGDVIVVEYEHGRTGRIIEQEMELTSEYRGWWRGKGTDGATKWNYTRLLLGDKIMAGERRVVLRAYKGAGRRDQNMGYVTDVRIESAGDFDFS